MGGGNDRHAQFSHEDHTITLTRTLPLNSGRGWTRKQGEEISISSLYTKA